MAALLKFIRASDRLVTFDSKFQPDAHTLRTLTLFQNKITELWQSVDKAYKAFDAQYVDDPENDDARAERTSVEDKYSGVFTTYVSLLARIEGLMLQKQAEGNRRNQDGFLNFSENQSVASAPSQASQSRGPRRCEQAGKRDLLQVPVPPHVPRVSDRGTMNEFKSAASAVSVSVSQADNNVMVSRFLESNSTQVPLPPPTDYPVSCNLALPPCEIEVFNGECCAWPSFRDLFTAVIIRNTRLSNIERLIHLRNRTAGEAKIIVHRAPLTNDGFDMAWNCLCDEYENTRVLVNSQLRKFFSIAAVTKESAQGLRRIQRDIHSVLHILHMHKVSTDNWDPFLVYHCSQRIPEATVILFEASLKNRKAVPSWSSLDSFLGYRAETLESAENTRHDSLTGSNNNNPAGPSKRAVNSHHMQKPGADACLKLSAAKPPSNSCPFCPREKHNVRGCKKFKAMSLSERWNAVRQHHLCSNCLSVGHAVDKCNSTFNCSACHKRHHSWLHSFQPSNNAAPGAPNGESTLNNANTKQNQSSFHQHSLRSASDLSFTGKKMVLLGTANILLHHHGVLHPVRALIDSGSEVSCITRALKKRLRLPTKPANISLLGVNSQVTASASQSCRLVIGSVYDSAEKYECSAFVLPRISGNLPSASISWVDKNCLQNLQLADNTFYESSQVDLLLGADIYPLILRNGVQHNVLGSLVAQETSFGWILTGCLPDNQNDRPSASVHFTSVINNDDILRKFWELEELPKEKYLTMDEQYCEKLFASTTKRNADGRYVVQLPFKKEYSSFDSLGDSRASVAAIFRRTEMSLLRKPEFKPVYDGILKEYLELDHMREVSAPKNDSTSDYFYLPHHPVFKPDSTTTAVRIVFNASHASTNGRSLNDILYPGPALQNDLMSLLLKWRLPKYVFSSDITKMYRQILVDPTQTRYHRILFRDDPQHEIRDYEMKTVTFGVNCAPFLAIRTLLRLADDVQSEYPMAAEILRQHMYVDDVLAGYEDIATALSARDEIIAALNSAGFLLRKWSSNDKRILQDLSPDLLLSQDFLEFEEASSSKALGVRWNALRDEFFFRPLELPQKSSCTKREVLSIIAKLFDPAGWLAPIVVVAKILMQKIWLDGTGWDEPISSQSMERWTEFVNNFGNISNIRVPRWIGYNSHIRTEIHGFCDASEKAYAACLYLRCEQFNVVQCHLLCAKSKVAPIKTLSVPRLELCGALLLSQLFSHVLPELSISPQDQVCWTDSTIVLAWLQKPPCAWKCFVAARVSKIQSALGTSCWRHISGAENPADLASRGTLSPEFSSNTLWWNGPSWLPQSPASWPSSPIHKLTTTEELKPANVHVSLSLPSIEELLSRFSSLSRMLRVMSYVLRFTKAVRGGSVQKTSELSSSELNSTKLTVIRLIQRLHFSTEIDQLCRNVPIARKSSILALNPMLDSSKILRANGRLIHASSLTFAEKFPIILPTNSHFSYLLLDFIHAISLHGGNRLMLRLLRQEFWMPRAQIKIKALVNRCKVCILFRQRQHVQLMSSLPTERSSFERPFSTTGVDFTGPFDIKNFTGRACRITKGYVCVFVCFSTKAVHLEVTNNLSTDSFLAALARFVSRRGCPRKIMSDNGTNFVGANATLKREFQKVLASTADAANRQFSHQQLQWDFIPAGAPHMGGLWEAGVKSFKSHFRKIAMNFKYTFEEMCTLLCRIEACMNSRPLCLNPDTSLEDVALTPGHFLIGSAFSVLLRNLSRDSRPPF